MVKTLLFICAFGLCARGRAFNEDSLKLHNRYLVLNAGYRLPLNNTKIINSGHGLYLEAGLNLARFFNKRTVIGLFAGFAAQDRLWNTSFRQGFVNDYRQAIDARQGLSSADSAIVAGSARLFGDQHGKAPLMPGCATGSFHSYNLYCGIILRLRVPPALKLYAGSTRSHFQGEPVIAGQSYSILELRRAMYGAELMLQGSSLPGLQAAKWLQHAGLGIYYEYYDLYASTLYFDNGERQRRIALKAFTSHSFLHRYRHDEAFGVKLFYML